ncbi:MAG: hypothetical protein RL216_2874 [Pseudomonadota bacterium]|jgi:predicted transcriptional regulator
MLNLTKELLADLDGQELLILRDRIAEADAGDFIPADQVEEWVSSWFTSGELPPPEPDAAPPRPMA